MRYSKIGRNRLILRLRSSSYCRRPAQARETKRDPGSGITTRTLERTNSAPSRGLCQRRNRSLTFFLCIFNLQFLAVCKFCRTANDRKRAPGAEVQELKDAKRDKHMIQHRTWHWHRTCQAPQRKANAVAIATERRTSGSTSREHLVRASDSASVLIAHSTSTTSESRRSCFKTG